MTRIPIIREDTDGTIIDGTALIADQTIGDFRDLDGQPLVLPPGSKFVIPLEATE